MLKHLSIIWKILYWDHDHNDNQITWPTFVLLEFSLKVLFIIYYPLLPSTLTVFYKDSKIPIKTRSFYK